MGINKLDRNGAEYNRRYEKLPCPHCGAKIGKQGLANHIRKHGEQPKPKPSRLPSYFNASRAVAGNSELFKAHREGYLEGMKHVIDSLRLIGIEVPIDKIERILLP